MFLSIAPACSAPHPYRAGGPQRLPHDEPHFHASARLGAGNSDVETIAGASLTGETNAGLVGVEFEGMRESLGGGLRVDAYATDDELFADTLPGSDSSAAAVELFPHLSVRTGGDAFRMPIRLGPVAQTHTQEIDGISLDYFGLGGQVEIEPEVHVFGDDKQLLSIYGRLQAGITAAEVDGDAIASRSTDATLLGAEIGVRYRFGSLLLGVGYLHRSTTYDESDVVNGTVVGETEFRFDGGFVSVGARW